MAAAEETTQALRVAAQAQTAPTTAPKSTASPLTLVLKFLSSVKLGIFLLCLLAAFCLVGMLIMQQNVEGFDKYYAALTPAQRVLYGRLGVFDIYHVWYFNALLVLLSLNIVLASIDRFPKAWTFISRPKLDASPHWLKGQEQSAVLTLNAPTAEVAAEKISEAYRAIGIKDVRVTDKKGKKFVFGQVNTWNRLGAYAVHVSLLTIFAGGFLTARFGVTGSMPLQDGMKSSQISETVFDLDQLKQEQLSLPFEAECLDIKQTLIRKDGPITANNTLDWFTKVRLTDKETGQQEEALIHLNAPVDYRGYRLFQASFSPVGRARNITVQVTPANGGAAQEIKLGKLDKASPYDGTSEGNYETVLSDGTKVKFTDFRAAFTVGEENPNMDTSSYPNPAAVLQVTPPNNGEPQQAFAFNPEMAEKAPFAKQPVAGYTFRLTDFEKVSDAHILSIQRDPGVTWVYIGFLLLGITLCAVFFFAHQRVWAAIEPKDGKFVVTLGGNANRSRLAFEERFKKLVQKLSPAV